jgi:F0F1-type ATP synthase membrane subunit c/vacuolar-type H+-ATPase subunit K
MFKKIYIMLFFFFLLFSYNRFEVIAQNNSISLTIVIEGDVPSEPNGSIVVLDKGVYKISNKKSDPNQVGVITLNPAVTLRRSANQNVYDVNTSGTTLIKATNRNGKITKGDYLTSSDTLGVAQKSTESEYVIGVAAEDFDTESGNVRVNIEPRYILLNASTGTNLLNVVRQSSQSVFLAPVDSLRYILAAIVAIASFLFGFSIFGKITGSGIQALARNPLARSSIQINIIIEFILNIGIIIFGIIVSYFILTL